MSQMTDFEAALLTAIISYRDIRTPIKYKITADFFSSAVNRAAFQYLISWFKNPTYGDTPSWETFLDNFTGFAPVEVEDSVAALCDKVREKKLFEDQAATIAEWGRIVQGDPAEGFKYLMAQTARLVNEHKVDEAAAVSSLAETLRNEFLSMKEGHTNLKGKPWPWPALNDATLGFQDGQIAFIYGRPKSKKTWLALAAMQGFWAAGAVPLIFSQELTDIEIARRWVALTIGVDYDAMTRGLLEGDDECRFYEQLELFAEQPPVVISTLTGRGEACLTELSAAIDEHGATVVLIDGFNYLGDDTKEIGMLVRGTKHIAKSKRIPILATAHRNRDKTKNSGGASEFSGADDFYGSDTYYQSCDLALRATAEIEHKRKREVNLWTAAIREGKSTMFTVNTHLCSDMSQKELISFGDSDVEGSVDDEIDQDAALDGQEDERAE